MFSNISFITSLDAAILRKQYSARSTGGRNFDKENISLLLLTGRTMLEHNPCQKVPIDRLPASTPPPKKKEIRNWCSPFLLFWLSPPHVFPSFSTFFCCAIEASSPFPSFFSSSVIFPSPPPILPLPICHRFQVGTGRLKLKNGRQHYETCPTVLKNVAEWETFNFFAILRHTSRPFVFGSTLILLLQRRHRKKEKEEKKNKEPQELRQWTFQQPKAKRRLRGPRGKEKTKTIFH